MKILLAPALLLAAGACNGSGGAGNAASATNAGANQAASPAPANASAAANKQAADEADVRAFLERIYAPYARDDAPGREIASFMEPQLAAALNRSEEGINADPFIDAQDYAPFRPEYGALRVSGDRADATVRIDSLGERTLNYRLVRTPAGWKIADIISTGSGSLREAYGLAPLN